MASAPARTPLWLPLADELRRYSHCLIFLLVKLHPIKEVVQTACYEPQACNRMKLKFEPHASNREIP
jgi:hypothetical protein